MKNPSLRFVTPSTPEDIPALRSIFREYAEGLKVDLCFQGFEAELAELPGEYAAPRGALLLDTLDEMESARVALPGSGLRRNSALLSLPH